MQVVILALKYVLGIDKHIQNSIFKKILWYTLLTVTHTVDYGCMPVVFPMFLNIYEVSFLQFQYLDCCLIAYCLSNYGPTLHTFGYFMLIVRKIWWLSVQVWFHPKHIWQFCLKNEFKTFFDMKMIGLQSWWTVLWLRL